MRTKQELTTAIRRAPRVVLVVNTRSRRARAAHPRLPGMLAAVGAAPQTTLAVADPAHLRRTLHRAVEVEPDLLVVGGGDGTMATAAALLAYRDIAMGVLPLGTTNNFARSLGLPLRLPEAVHAIGTGFVADVDLGRLRTEDHDDLFANLVSVGLSVEVAARTPHAAKRWLGRSAYALTATRVLPGHRPFAATVTTADGMQRFCTHQLNVANGRFHAGRPIARDASIDDRLLIAYRLGGGRRGALSLRMVEHVARGGRRNLAQARFLVASEVHLATDPVLGIDVDGEVRGTTPATVGLAAQALRVIVPPGFVDS